MLKKLLLLNILLSLTCTIFCQLDYRALYTTSLTCQMGRNQSPIDLSETTSAFNSTISFTSFSYFGNGPVKLDWSPDGRVLMLNDPDRNMGYMALSRNGVLKQYSFQRIEINFPSEHTIEGIVSDAEVKFIHEKVLPFETTVNQYRRIPDANTQLVVSFLYSSTSNITDNGFLDQLLSTLPASYTNNTSLYNVPAIGLDVLTYGMLENRKFYFYDGSQTSLPCDEVVSNIVIKDNFYLNPVARQILLKAYSKYGYTPATKAISQLYGRNVTRNYMNATEASSSFMKINLFICAIFFMLLL